MAGSGRHFLLASVILAASLLGACEDKTASAIARGNQAAKAGKLNDAASAYESATKSSPENARPYELLGHVYLQLGKSDDARKAYESALQRLPSSVDARIGLARLDGEAGKRDEAIK